MNKVLIPLIRDIVPNLIAEDIISVQPMSGEVFGNTFEINIREKPIRDRFGNIIHSFIDGYLIYNGLRFVSFECFVAMYPDLNYEELFTHKHSRKWGPYFEQLREKLTCPVCAEGILVEHYTDHMFYSICTECESEVANLEQTRRNKEIKLRMENRK